VSDVHHDVDRHRYELTEDGHLAFADYLLDGDVMTFTHTVVPREIGGRGIASHLIGAALADVQARDRKVVAQCSFVAGYFQKHPELADLLA